MNLKFLNKRNLNYLIGILKKIDLSGSIQLLNTWINSVINTTRNVGMEISVCIFRVEIKINYSKSIGTQENDDVIHAYGICGFKDGQYFIIMI